MSYGPYPAVGFGATGQLDAATGTLYWIKSSTNVSGANYSVVVSHIGRDIVVHDITLDTIACGTGTPTGRLLRDPSTGYLYVCVESGYAYSTWYQFKGDGTYLTNLGGLGLADGPLRTCQDAIFDGAGNMLHLTDVLGSAVITVIPLSPFAVSGSVSLTYTGSSRVAIGATNSIWVLSTDGSNGAIDLVDASNPASPTVTSYSLGAGGAFVEYTVVYDSGDDTLLFWWNDKLNKWSCSSHSIVTTISTSTYTGSGPLQGGILTSGIGFYVATDLSVSPITGVGFNPSLPDFTFTAATGFKHFYDQVGEVIWLQVNDTTVWGAILGGLITLTCASGTASLGVPYNSALTASGGIPPYTYSIIAGSLPPGLTLDGTTGLISGTPIQIGRYPYTAQVVDNVGSSATASCVITVGTSICGSCAPQQMFSLEITRDLDADWKDSSTFLVIQDVPFPFTLRGIVMRMSYNQD